ncbi:polysaccharide deacetylase family protein [Paenibacillus sp. JCM 10914]|uniref:polysaccharide deacetylase family protein n=1 Tax=Paenibacillus sp. JCM 10914 TaxID=1236974 RepID=UPI0003CC5210|nr:polysaccharide deacetylase family protein [Paenibacillus sp. JCM 10914]GAE04830.1 polysaccharide deacetylase, putative [Paenibacillus sp. JCM 10914]
MYGKKIAVLLTGAALVSAVAVFSGAWNYVSSLSSHPESRLTSVNETAVDLDLLAQIEAEAAKTRIEPVDAKVDSVWKAVPGYNGLEIDVEATFKSATTKKFKPGDSLTYIYRQIPAKVTLDDLGEHPIYRGNPNKPMVSLMINVAWGNEYLVPMLNTLDAEQVKTTFFLDGSWLKKNPELAGEILKRGHEVENHAYTHPNMSRLSRERAELEIAKTQDLLKSSLGVDNKWFAPPSGDFNQQTVSIAAARGLKTVLWTLDTIDWKHPAPDAVVQKISSKVEPGFLILMHPTDTSSAALKGMIDGIRAKGLQIGTVSQTLSSDRIMPGGS